MDTPTTASGASDAPSRAPPEPTGQPGPERRLNPWMFAAITALGHGALAYLATRGASAVGGPWAVDGVLLPVLGPALAFAITAVALWGAPMAFAVGVGSAAATAMLPIPTVAKAVLVLSTTLAALVGGRLMIWAHLLPSFRRVRDVYVLVVVGAAIPAALIAIGIAAGGAYGPGLTERFTAAGQVMAETATGIVVMAPLLLMMLDPVGRRRPTRFDTGRATRDRGLVIIAVVALTFIAFSGMAPAGLGAAAALVLFPFLAVTATRLAPGTLAFAVMVVGLGALAAAFAGRTFVATTGDLSVFWLAESFAAGIAVTTLLVHAVVRERQGVQVSLGTAQEQYKRLLDYAPDLIVSVDRRGRVLFTNRSLGTHPPAEARGISFLEMFEGEAATVVRDRLGLVFNTGNRTRCEVPGKGSRGRATWYALELGPVRDETGVVAAMVILRDVTDKRLAEEQLREREARLRALFEGSTLAIAVIGRDGRIQEANAAFGALVGKDASMCVDEAWLGFVAEEDRPGEEALLLELLDGHRDSYQLEARFHGPRGHDRWVRSTVSLVRDPDGAPLFAVAMAEDIMARLKAEEADRVASDRLREIERLEEVSEWKTQLLNIASHEIKNPLVPIRIQLDLLRKGKYGTLNEGQEKAVSIVERESRRLADLVNDVLDMARVQVGRMHVDPDMVDVAPLLDEAVEAFQAAAEEGGIDLRRSGGDGVRALADAPRIRQVLVNLLSNAMKFTPAGGTITVAVEPHDDMVRFNVSDTGPGMSEEQIERLFQPFSQVHDPKTGPSGTGIGLFISRGIVEAHGGAIGCSSAGPGRGSTFWFELPSA